MDEAQFIEALCVGHVNGINVFGLCHHGWCYYPTRVGKPHPTLNTDLQAFMPVVREIAERYRSSGFWFDITGGVTCACPACVAGAAQAGLDLERYGATVFNYLRRTSEAVWRILPEASIYHNSSNDPLREDPALLADYSHLEIESLPTGFWGYEFFPVHAKYFKPKYPDAAVVGMTGKFHTSWGEFGGGALRFEESGQSRRPHRRERRATGQIRVAQGSSRPSMASSLS